MTENRTEVAMDPALVDAPTEAHEPVAYAPAAVPCAACGTALADDQRYCLECGNRQGEPRVAYRGLIAPARGGTQAGLPPTPAVAGSSPRAAGAGAAVAGAGAASLGAAAAAGSVPPAGDAPPPVAAVASPAAPRDLTPLVTLGGLAALALVLVVGVLIGRSGTDAPQQAAATQVIKLDGAAAPAAAPAASATTAEIVEDWPAGETGFAVSLGTLPKDGTTAAQVESTKTAATAAGTTEVGVLDSDAHGSLAPGEWVVYSGVFETRAQATRALARLRANHPDARVIEVADDAGGSGSGAGSAGAGSGDAGAGASEPAPSRAPPAEVRALEEATGEDYQRKSRALPDTLALPGKPPPKDDAAPGGGSEAETIG